MIPLELEGPGVCFEGPKSALGAPKVVYCIFKVLYIYTPLLKWPIGKNCDPKTGILHIGRDP